MSFEAIQALVDLTGDRYTVIDVETGKRITLEPIGKNGGKQ